MDIYFGILTLEQREKVNEWLRAEGLMDLGVVRYSVVDEGSVEVEHLDHNDDGKPFLRNGTFAHKTITVKTASAPPVGSQ